MADMGDQWVEAIRTRQHGKLLRHFGHHHIRRLLQAYGDMKVAPLAESASETMTDTPDVFDEVFAITRALRTAHMRVLTCFTEK
jgi:hypothetical protein